MTVKTGRSFINDLWCMNTKITRMSGTNSSIPFRIGVLLVIADEWGQMQNAWRALKSQNCLLGRCLPLLF
jgi:hypothetical protein